jgi:HD-GYP domain-containing protein (c-di-GMP phosphodiesterase class II)
MKNTTAVAGVPAHEILEVPVSVAAQLRHAPFPVFDVKGTALRTRNVRDTQMAYVLSDDAAALLECLREDLSELMEASSIPAQHRAWALRYVLLRDIEDLYEGAVDGEMPLGLPRALDEVGNFLSRAAGAPLALMQVIDEDEPSLATHALHNAFLSLMLAHASGFRRADQLAALGFGAVCGDLGLAGQPFELLTSDSLGYGEQGLLEEHPRRSLEIMRRLGLMPQTAHEAVLWHHERWDGAGYPDGVAGDDLPFAARCVALADRYDLLKIVRGGKRAAGGSVLGEMSAIEDEFDPALQQMFVKMLHQHGPGSVRRRFR